MNIKVQLRGRDSLELLLEVENGKIQKSSLKAVGCHEFLTKVQQLRGQLKGALDELPLIEGNDHASVMLRETVLRAQNKWNFPYTDAELCHCRAIPTANVDEAIVAGSHNVEDVAQSTSAGTACGSCRKDSQKIIDYRLNRKAS